MANIDQYIEQIENARYGNEVRQAIVDALTAMNAEISSSGVSSFNERRGHVISTDGDYNISQISATGGMQGQVPVVNNNGGFTMRDIDVGGVLVAPDFDETIAYKVGDYVTYDGNTYIFKTSKLAGAWDSTKVEQQYAMGAYVTAGKHPSFTLGKKATAEGKESIASGDYSHAEGLANTASGSCAHAEGNANRATGHHSHAEGQANQAGGNYSHAEGSNTKASHSWAHAEGYQTKTGTDYQHVQGKYNVGKSTTLFEIGNGTANDARSNAFEVDTDGNVTVYGNLTVVGTITHG